MYSLWTDDQRTIAIAASGVGSNELPLPFHFDQVQGKSLTLGYPGPFCLTYLFHLGNSNPNAQQPSALPDYSSQFKDFLPFFWSDGKGVPSFCDSLHLVSRNKGHTHTSDFMQALTQLFEFQFWTSETKPQSEQTRIRIAGGMVCQAGRQGTLRVSTGEINQTATSTPIGSWRFQRAHNAMERMVSELVSFVGNLKKPPWYRTSSRVSPAATEMHDYPLRSRDGNSFPHGIYRFL